MRDDRGGSYFIIALQNRLNPFRSQDLECGSLGRPRERANAFLPNLLRRLVFAVSGPAQRTALEVLAAEGVETILGADDEVTATPVISHAILVYNRGRTEHKGDGIVITPSHNPPADGGFKYNPPHGGPADSDVTSWIRTAPMNCSPPATPT